MAQAIYSVGVSYHTIPTVHELPKRFKRAISNPFFYYFYKALDKLFGLRKSAHLYGMMARQSLQKPTEFGDNMVRAVFALKTLDFHGDQLANHFIGYMATNMDLNRLYAIVNLFRENMKEARQIQRDLDQERQERIQNGDPTGPSALSPVVKAMLDPTLGDFVNTLHERLKENPSVKNTGDHPRSQYQGADIGPAVPTHNRALFILQPTRPAPLQPPRPPVTIAPDLTLSQAQQSHQTGPMPPSPYPESPSPIQDDKPDIQILPSAPPKQNDETERPHPQGKRSDRERSYMYMQETNGCFLPRALVPSETQTYLFPTLNAGQLTGNFEAIKTVAKPKKITDKATLMTLLDNRLSESQRRPLFEHIDSLAKQLAVSRYKSPKFAFDCDGAVMTAFKALYFHFASLYAALNGDRAVSLSREEFQASIVSAIENATAEKQAMAIGLIALDSLVP